MDEIVKICKVHGELTKDCVRKNGKRSPICKHCRREYEKQTHVKEIHKKYNKIWRKNNKEKQNELSKKNQKKYIQNYGNCYIRDLLIHNGFHINSITSELIGMKAIQLKLKRTIEGMKDEKHQRIA